MRHFYYVVVSGNVNSGAISGVVKHLAKDRSEPWENGGSPVGPTPTRQNSGEPQLLLGKYICDILGLTTSHNCWRITAITGEMR